jgi:hypothetical protein
VRRITFPYTGDLEFEDLEADAAAPGCARRRTRVRARASRRSWRSFGKQVHRDGHDYALMPTDIPPSRTLRSYLLRTRRGGQRHRAAR